MMSSKRRASGLVALAAAAFALLVGPAAPARSQSPSRRQLTEEFHQSYPLAAGGRVSLANVNGRVRVTGWDRPEVRVDAVKRAHTPERLREAEIKVTAAGNIVRIETKYPDWTHPRADDDKEHRHYAASVDYNVSVPRGARVEEVSVVNGPLEIENIGGAVRASAVNGRVTARGLTGAVRLSVVNGRLDAAFDRLDAAQAVTLGSVSGPLFLTIPSDSNAFVKASTVSGPISSDFKLPVRQGEYVGHHLDGRLGTGGARLRLSNVSGPITIRRAPDGRPLSPATDVRSEAGADEGDAVTRTNEEIRRSVEASVRDSQRDAARERERLRLEAQRESERERLRHRLEAERERLRVQREAARDRLDAQREAARASGVAPAEAARARSQTTRATTQTATATTQTARPAPKANPKIENEVQKGVNKNVVNQSRQIARETNNVVLKAGAGPPRVRLETFDGNVTVHGWDKPQVAYTAIKRAFDDHEMKGISINLQANKERGDVIVRAEFNKAFARDVVERAGRVISFNSGASADFDVYVPRDAILTVSTGDGRLRVENVGGQLLLHTGDGSIDVAGGRGHLKADTGSGRIRVDGFDGHADVRTGDGRIALDGRFEQLAARTGDGTISLAIAGDFDASIETNATSVVNDGVAVAVDEDAQKRVRRWRVGNGGRPITLRTGDGQIILRRR